MRRLSILCALASISCATAAPSASSDENAPTPYTAEQIRDAARTGRIYDFSVELLGMPPAHHILRFTAVTDRTADYETTDTNEAGHPFEAPQTTHSTWEELRDHAKFLRAVTTVDDEQVTVPAGTFDCVRYQVRGEKPGVVRVFEFAKSLPGPPIRFYIERDGKRMMTAQLARYVPGG